MGRGYHLQELKEMTLRQLWVLMKISRERVVEERIEKILDSRMVQYGKPEELSKFIKRLQREAKR